jgi:hypothetical protein
MGYPVETGRSTIGCDGRNQLDETKPFVISKRAVWDAYRKVKANKGGAGVDEQSLAQFEQNLKGNLYKLWNRLSSGSYFPPPVKLVEIDKKGGGVRPLGVPTVADRIAQTELVKGGEGIAEQRQSRTYRTGLSPLLVDHHLMPVALQPRRNRQARNPGPDDADSHEPTSSSTDVEDITLPGPSAGDRGVVP